MAQWNRYTVPKCGTKNVRMKLLKPYKPKVEEL